MVAPGKHLEFHETLYYTAKLKPLPDLANAVAEHLRCWPACGTVVSGQVRQCLYAQGLQTFAVVYSRHGNNLGLMNIFEMPKDGPALSLYLQGILELQKNNSSRRQP